MQHGGRGAVTAWAAPFLVARGVGRQIPAGGVAGRGALHVLGTVRTLQIWGRMGVGVLVIQY